MTSSRREPALVPVLVFTAMVASVISSLGAPLLPTISNQFHVSLSTAQWSLTITLLVGTISSPIMGRLGDGPRRRETLVIGLVAVTLGGGVAALAPGLGLLLVGRGLQGIGLGLIPLTMAAARDHLPRERVNAAIAVLSVSAAAGVGIGYPMSGLIADRLGLSAAYWAGAVVSALAVVCVVAVVPSSNDRPATSLDVWGIVLLTTGLVALLLAIAEGNNWGWTSPAVLGLLAGSAVVLTGWVFRQLNTRAPLIELRLLRHSAVLTSNACAIVLGVAMYMYISAITEFVQAPASAGYGFDASVVVAGLCLVPFSIASFAASRALPWITARIGTRALLPVGCLVVAVAGVFFALFHTALWQAFVMLAVVGVGVGLTSAAIPGLIIRAVPEQETGSAMGFYQVVRSIGFSLGSALAASILAGHTPSGHQLPTESGYILVLWIAAAVCVVAATLSWVIAPRAPRALNPNEERLLEEDAELGPTGFTALPQ